MKIKNKKGFTLIEITIAIFVVSLMSTVVFVSMRTSKIDKELESSALEVVAAIRETQNNALNGKKPNDNYIPCRYEFKYRVGGVTNSYRISYYYYNHGVAGESCQVPMATPQVFANYTLKNSVTFSGTNDSYFFFGIPFGDITPVIADSTYIQLTKNTRSHYVCITRTGKIYEKKALPCT